MPPRPPPEAILSIEFDELSARMQEAGQGHLLAHWSSLSEDEREAYAASLATLDYPLVQKLAEGGYRPSVQTDATFEPPELIAIPDSPESLIVMHEARALGEQALRAGKVGLVLVAGGQGSRLGFDGPKGLYPITPVRELTLYEWFARQVGAVRRLYGTALPWAIMTSTATRGASEGFFKSNRHFDLDPQSLWWFEQRVLPVTTPSGRVVLESPTRVATAPDGHGGCLGALGEAGLLDRFRKAGVEHLFYFQVDNPLARVADPVFIGLHIDSQAEVSTKVVEKTNADERVGVVGKINGRDGIIEYTDLPAAERTAREQDGALRFRAGNCAIHLFDMSFLEQNLGNARLPYHRARKTMEIYDATTGRVEPTPVVKYEQFIFDLLPRAARTLNQLVRREEEFSPVKNASGADSPQTCREAQNARGRRWLMAAGAADADTLGDRPVEIDPAVAMDAGALRVKAGASAIRVPPAGSVLIA
jgi:UDP-N-acetylglucosamine/UDP-N-acetylgalactosamine diphosphorylase